MWVVPVRVGFRECYSLPLCGVRLYCVVPVASLPSGSSAYGMWLVVTLPRGEW